MFQTFFSRLISTFIGFCVDRSQVKDTSKIYNGISRMLEMCPVILPSGLILSALNPLLTINYALNIREAAPVQHHNLSDTFWLSIWHFHRLIRSELHAYTYQHGAQFSLCLCSISQTLRLKEISWENSNVALFLFLFFVPKRLLLCQYVVK